MNKLIKTFLSGVFLLVTFAPPVFSATQNVQNGGWENIGLKNVGISAFTIGADSELYAATATGQGIQRYDVTQNLWTPMNTGLPDSTPINGITTYANNLYVSLAEYGIYQYDRVNHTWVSTNNGLPQPYSDAYELIVNNNVLYAIVNGRVYWYNSDNKEWHITDSGKASLSSLISYNNTLYAVATAGNNVYQYNVINNQWQTVYQPITPGQLSHIIFYNNTLYASTLSNGVYKFDATTQTWEAVNNGLDVTGGLGFGDFTIYHNTLYLSVQPTYSGANGMLYQYDAVKNSWSNNPPPAMKTGIPLAFIVYYNALYIGASSEFDGISGGVFRLFTN